MATREVDLGSIAGPQGPQGETGPTGPQGPKGADGATWLSGTAVPNTQGKDGDYYINTSTWDIYKKASGSWAKTGNIKGATGATGPQGPQGEKGDPFAIAKTYASITAMNAAYASDGVKIGQFVAIDTGNINDADNAKLYLKGPSAYIYITDMSGATGLTGPQGPKGATGAAGAIGPQGPKGDKGDTGATGPQGPAGARGATGATGPKGDKGDPGVSPTFQIRSGHLYAIYSD